MDEDAVRYEFDDIRMTDDTLVVIAADGGTVASFQVIPDGGARVNTDQVIMAEVRRCTVQYSPAKNEATIKCVTALSTFVLAWSYPVPVVRFLCLCDWLRRSGVDIQVDHGDQEPTQVVYRANVRSFAKHGEDSIYIVADSTDPTQEFSALRLDLRFVRDRPGGTQVFVGIDHTHRTVDDVFGFKVDRYSDQDGSGGGASRKVTLVSSTSSRPCRIELTFPNNQVHSASELLDKLGAAGITAVDAHGASHGSSLRSLAGSASGITLTF